MKITLLQFLVLSFASFRLTRLVVFDKITEFLRRPFFEEFLEINENGEEEVYLLPKKNGLKGWIGNLLSCYWCTGIWIAACLYLCWLWIPLYSTPIILILAIAGGGALLETAVQHWLSDDY